MKTENRLSLKDYLVKVEEIENRQALDYYSENRESSERFFIF